MECDEWRDRKKKKKNSRGQMRGEWLRENERTGPNVGSNPRGQPRGKQFVVLSFSLYPPPLPPHSFHFLSTFFHSLLTVHQFVASFAFKSHIESRRNETFRNKNVRWSICQLLHLLSVFKAVSASEMMANSVPSWGMYMFIWLYRASQLLTASTHTTALLIMAIYDQIQLTFNSFALEKQVKERTSLY